MGQSLRLEPVLDDKAGYAEEVPQIVSDTNGTDRNRLRSNKRVHAPDLLAGLFEVTPHREGPPCCGFVECQHARTPQKRFEPKVFRPGRARPGETNPDFYNSDRGDIQRPARDSGDAIFKVAMPLFPVEHRRDDAGIK